MISANPVITASYDYGEVARSILIAIAGSYAALDLAGRVTAVSGRARARWLTGGAIAMGIGIWEMHFKGLLAFRLPLPVSYYWPTVLASFVVAVITSAVVLLIVSRQEMGPVQLWTSSFIQGGGIAAVHYIDMASMRLAAVCRFDLRIVILSIVVAIVFSFVALTLAFGLRAETRDAPWRRIASAIVMGAAISVMHYTGMASATFIASPMIQDLSHTVNISPLANAGVALITLLVLGVVIMTSSADRQAKAEARRVNEALEQRVAERTRQLEADIEDRERAEDELRRQKEVFQKIFEHLPVLIAFVGADGRIELVNPEWERTIGGTLQEIRQQDVDIFAEAYPDPQYRQMVLDFIAASTGEFIDLKVRARDGRVIDLSVAVVHLSDGTSVAIGRDITERKRAEAETRESEARFRLVADSASVMIWMSGTDKLCTSFNKPWLDFTGRSIDRELGNGWTDGVDPEDLQRCLDTYIQAFDRREAFRMEYRLRRHDGEYRWVLDTGVPRFNPERSFAGYIGSCIDVTEQRRAEEQLHQAQADLARVTRILAMGELVAAIAHEVNQPLAAIVINANFCLRQLANGAPNSDQLREAISEIANDGTRASAVISRIRALLQKGAHEQVELDINQIIEEVIILLRAELTRNRVSLRTDLGADLPRLSGDRVQLQQVMINLVMNGIEAMPSLVHRPRELLIKSATDHNEVLIQVQDSGEGFDPQQTEHIFQPFFTTKAEGIGMGLSISRSIIESHGGRLWAESGLEGTLFQFTLPAQ